MVEQFRQRKGQLINGISQDTCPYVRYFLIQVLLLAECVGWAGQGFGLKYKHYDKNMSFTFSSDAFKTLFFCTQECNSTLDLIEPS